MTGEPMFKHTPLAAEARITRLERELAALKVVLAWYADEKNYDHPEDGHMTFRSVVDIDEGERARKALLAESETDGS